MHRAHREDLRRSYNGGETVDRFISGLVTATEPIFLHGVDRLLFDSHHTSHLTCPNLVLHDESQLVMEPNTSRVKHTVTIDFPASMEAKFVGGSYISDATALTDPGIWVRDAASVVLAGRKPTPVAHLQAVTGNTLALAARPVGWMRGDTIVVCPTAPGDYTSFEERTIVRVQDKVVTINAPLTHQHPPIKLPTNAAGGVGRHAQVRDLSGLGGAGSTPAPYAYPEVLHLERNVELNGKGAGGGHPHMHIQSTAVQSMNGVCWENFGVPRDDILGRYPVHVHHCFDANRGQSWSHLVVQHSGQRAFVPHESHGITWPYPIAYDIRREAYWWDQKAADETSETNDNAWQYPVAAKITGPHSGTAAFELRNGSRNSAISPIAVGNVCPGASSGFGWPTNANGTWLIPGLVAHNNAGHGIYVWQNTGTDHPVPGVVIYHNGKAGILEGSYLNHYLFDGGVLLGNVGGGITQTAVSDLRGALPLTYRNYNIDCAGASDYAVQFSPPEIPTSDARKDHRVHYEDSTFAGYRKYAIGFVVGAKTPNGPQARFTRCKVPDMNTLIWLPDWLDPETFIEWDDGIAPFTILPLSSPLTGVPHPEWNAKVLA